MKYPILLSALLLSGPPVFADDFVYLRCEDRSIATTRDLKSSQATKEEGPTDVFYLWIDLANSRLMSVRYAQWEEIEIVNGEVVIDKEWTDDGFNSSWKFSMQVVPPARILGEGIR